ncbi:MAG: 6-carboxytetrahydropterin synthase [Liquorilactobacillus nagelii]|jgi:6-pyruvoyltetrahydropterin/6-carboxytetrahydropterin synthase|uniref:6-carboxytetrahydropterin synthase n=1 Tax=Liquorilactobacillus nagelii TaxID=82688 RepID=UPI0006EFC5C2|nr:6-carboxytetrahydropterin synthase [Liquorilactobacillus nagelii]KRL42312.1 6-pyruvoyl-tetrahydropterin synthase [Liquorilactobacillus nagelii DSM 13675]MCI1921636.1 6-carboxytetrahydropterin synthase [Liquorilactobacillus nagelii]MCI1977238.1 6-carboxytetrahydropterin synthase [Liquorilactobacillus nagelii]QYH55016.1 6-pyruvoyl tetrahydropterin synthase [Liquorilactobacillus nagelii DSM 13675]
MTLKYSYKIRSFFNASHAVRWENGIGQQHTHTWEVVCELSSSADKTVIFKEIEDTIHKVFQTFSGKFLNNLPYFKETNPTVENVTVWLYQLLTEAFLALGIQLIRIEVGESPTRSYCISVAD